MKIRHLSGTDRNAAVAVWEAAELTRPWNDPAADADRTVHRVDHSIPA